MSIKSGFDKFIPKHFGGKGFLNMLELLSKCTTLSTKRALGNKEYNDNIWPSVAKEAMEGKFIEIQPKLEDLRYGKRVKAFDKAFMKGIPLNGSHNTCGIVAVYNALEDLGLSPSMPKLLYDFERKGIVLKGYFGSSFKQIVRYLSDFGLECQCFMGKSITEDNIDYLQGEYTTFILITYNDYRSLLAMMHTMCISKMEEGYQLHNAYDGGIKYLDLKSAVFGYNAKGERRSKPIGIVGIKR